jgi:phosphoglycerol transferase
LEDITITPKSHRILKNIIQNDNLAKFSEKKVLLLEYFFVILISSLFTFYLFRSLHPTVPMSYSGDEISNIAVFKVMMETGSPLPWSKNFNYGAPLGTTELDYPMSDNLHFMGIYFLQLIFKDAVIANNLYYLLTFLFTSVTAYYVLKEFDIPFVIALPGALSYAFLPYHILRESHIFLAGYYLIPLIILLAYKVEIGKINFFGHSTQSKKKPILSIWKRKEFWVSLILCLLFGSSGVYYAFFAVAVLILLSAKSLILKKYQISLMHLIIAGMICLSVLINISPSIYYKWNNGPTSIPVGSRNPSESEKYGLKIIQMLLPSTIHQIASFRELNNAYTNNFPNVNENRTSSLGIMGSIGLLLAIIFLFTPKREDPLMGFLGFSTLSSLLLGTVGGFGAIFSLLISSSIRSYNRISVFIAFFAISTFCLIVKDLYFKYISAEKDKYYKYIILVLLSGLVFFDQVQVIYPYNQEESIDEYISDSNFVMEIENQLPDNALVFQLPFMNYPEGTPIKELRNYDHFKMYLHSSKLRWSYGAMKGRESAEWNRSTASLPFEAMVTALSLSNFSGIQIDRNGYSEGEWRDLENTLTNILGVKPIISRNRRLVFFNLQPYIEDMRTSLSRPDWDRFAEFFGFVYLFKGEFSKPDKDGNYFLPCNGKEGILSVTNINKEYLPTTISFGVVSSSGGEGNLRIKSQAWDETVTINEKTSTVQHQVNVSRDPLDIRFSCEVARTDPADNQPAEMEVRLENFNFEW